MSVKGQSANAAIPIDVTLSGIITVVSEEQEENADCPILPASFGICTPASDMQFWNIPTPMRSILVGSVTLVR